MPPRTRVKKARGERIRIGDSSAVARKSWSPLTRISTPAARASARTRSSSGSLSEIGQGTSASGTMEHRSKTASTAERADWLFRGLLRVHSRYGPRGCQPSFRGQSSGRLDDPRLPGNHPPVATRPNRQLPRQDFHLLERATFARRTITDLRFCCPARCTHSRGNSKRIPPKHARTVPDAGYVAPAPRSSA